MHVHRHARVHTIRPHSTLTISCDECSMQATSACAGCVVSFVLASTDDPVRPPGEHARLELDTDEARVVEMFGAAGMVPRLQYARRLTS
jgi:hypothetical protein